MKHIFEDEYSEREKYITCLHCGKPMADNQMVKDSYQLSTQFEWLKQQVKIVADILQDREQFTYSYKLYELIDKADKRLKF